MKKKLLCGLMILFISVLTGFNTRIEVNGAEVKDKNIDLVILFNDNSIDKNVENIITESGGKIKNEFSNLGGIEAECPVDLIPTIRAEKNVQSVAPNHAIKISSNEKTERLTESLNNYQDLSSDLYEEYQWDIKRVTNNGESFRVGSGNHDVVVGVIDSGVEPEHPDLEKNFLGGKIWFQIILKVIRLKLEI